MVVNERMAKPPCGKRRSGQERWRQCSGRRDACAMDDKSATRRFAGMVVRYFFFLRRFRGSRSACLAVTMEVRLPVRMGRSWAALAPDISVSHGGAVSQRHRHHLCGESEGAQRFVIDCVLAEGGELLERIVHGARPCIKIRVVLASLLVDCFRISGQLIPETVEIDAFAALHKPLYIRSAEIEVP